ncbi:hypothetical protein BN1708_008120 [Verticillium longisporum]|uniref:Uncharacterized protein n=1 Tax=Verticillium longisporum TaxID=100787 RepID=A0A0G4N0R8_VERLO|nr:hypothetical protein BN1708_008120 [Verticillium longisporum]
MPVTVWLPSGKDPGTYVPGGQFVFSMPHAVVPGNLPAGKLEKQNAFTSGIQSLGASTRFRSPEGQAHSPTD